MSKQYLTIKEFAEAVDKSRQSVYNQLTGKLSSYVKTVNGQKMLDSSALSEVYGIEVDNSVKEEVDKVDNIDSQVDLQKVDKLTTEVDRLTTEKNHLNQENDHYKKEVEHLMDEIDHLRSELALRNEEIGKIHELLLQQQQVNMVQARQLMLLQAPAEEEKEEAEPDEGQEEKQEEPIVKHWWQFWK